MPPVRHHPPGVQHPCQRVGHLYPGPRILLSCLGVCWTSWPPTPPHLQLPMEKPGPRGTVRPALGATTGLGLIGRGKVTSHPGGPIPCCFQSGEGAFWGQLTWAGGGRWRWSFSCSLVKVRVGGAHRCHGGEEGRGPVFSSSDQTGVGPV